jgi:hypothetical protein
MIRTPTAVNTASNAANELGVLVGVRNSPTVSLLSEIHQQVPGLLGHSLPVSAEPALEVKARTLAGLKGYVTDLYRPVSTTLQSRPSS